MIIIQSFLHIQQTFPTNYLAIIPNAKCLQPNLTYSSPNELHFWTSYSGCCHPGPRHPPHHPYYWSIPPPSPTSCGGSKLPGAELIQALPKVTPPQGWVHIQRLIDVQVQEPSFVSILANSKDYPSYGTSCGITGTKHCLTDQLIPLPQPTSLAFPRCYPWEFSPIKKR